MEREQRSPINLVDEKGEYSSEWAWDGTRPKDAEKGYYEHCSTREGTPAEFWIALQTSGGMDIYNGPVAPDQCRYLAGMAADLEALRICIGAYDITVSTTGCNDLGVGVGHRQPFDNPEDIKQQLEALLSRHWEIPIVLQPDRVAIRLADEMAKGVVERLLGE